MRGGGRAMKGQKETSLKPTRVRLDRKCKAAPSTPLIQERRIRARTAQKQNHQPLISAEFSNFWITRDWPTIERLDLATNPKRLRIHSDFLVRDRAWMCEDLMCRWLDQRLHLDPQSDYLDPSNFQKVKVRQRLLRAPTTHETIYFPVVSNKNHWVLFVFTKDTLRYFDPYHLDPKPDGAKLISQFPELEYEQIRDEEVPIQKDGWSCGPFCALMILHMLTGDEWTREQAFLDTDLFRWHFGEELKCEFELYPERLQQRTQSKITTTPRRKTSQHRIRSILKSSPLEEPAPAALLEKCRSSKLNQSTPKKCTSSEVMRMNNAASLKLSPLEEPAPAALLEKSRSSTLNQSTPEKLSSSEVMKMNNVATLKSPTLEGLVYFGPTKQRHDSTRNGRPSLALDFSTSESPSSIGATTKNVGPTTKLLKENGPVNTSRASFI